MAKAYLYDLTDTWNSAGTTFNAIRMSVTDTASAAGSLLMNLQVGGANRFSLLKSGVGLAHSEWQAPSIWATSVVYLGPSAQVGLATNGVGVLEQRGGTSAQTFRVYNTYTDASNYERLSVSWASNICTITTQGAGTGAINRRLDIVNASGQLLIGGGAGNPITLLTNGTVRWSVDGSTGHFLASTDNTYDIGASGASRPRNIYVAGQTDIAGLSGSITATAVTAGGTQALRMTTTSALGVYVGSGAPTVSAAKGSLYLRTDGTTTNDRMYVNTNGSTTWTAVTTVA